jgi:hypothetical protein
MVALPSHPPSSACVATELVLPTPLHRHSLTRCLWSRFQRRRQQLPPPHQQHRRRYYNQHHHRRRRCCCCCCCHCCCCHYDAQHHQRPRHPLAPSPPPLALPPPPPPSRPPPPPPSPLMPPPPSPALPPVQTDPGSGAASWAWQWPDSCAAEWPARRRRHQKHEKHTKMERSVRVWARATHLHANEPHCLYRQE